MTFSDIMETDVDYAHDTCELMEIRKRFLVRDDDELELEPESVLEADVYDGFVQLALEPAQPASYRRFPGLGFLRARSAAVVAELHAAGARYEAETTEIAEQTVTKDGDVVACGAGIEVNGMKNLTSVIEDAQVTAEPCSHNAMAESAASAHDHRSGTTMAIKVCNHEFPVSGDSLKNVKHGDGLDGDETREALKLETALAGPAGWGLRRGDRGKRHNVAPEMETPVVPAAGAAAVVPDNGLRPFCEPTAPGPGAAFRPAPPGKPRANRAWHQRHSPADTEDGIVKQQAQAPAGPKPPGFGATRGRRTYDPNASNV